MKNVFQCITALIICLVVSSHGSYAAPQGGPVREDAFSKGKRFLDSDNVKKAQEAWSEVLRTSPYGPVAYILLARGYRKAGDAALSESLLREFLRNNSGSIYTDCARDLLVEALVDQKKKEAVTFLEAMVRRASECEKTAPLLKLAILERHLGNYDKAATHYRELFLKYPASVEGLQASDDLAAMVLKKNISKPTFSESEQLLRAEKLFSRGRFDLAASAYETILKKRPSDKTLMIKLARCRFKGRNDQGAVSILKEVLKSGPSSDLSQEALYLLSLVYWRLDKDKEFESCNTKLLETGTAKFKKKALFNMGAHHVEKGRFSEAQAWYDRLLKAGPDSRLKVDVRWKLAWVRYFKQDYVKSAESFKEARLIIPGNSIEHASKYWQARSLLNLKRNQEAEALLVDLAQVNPFGYYGLEAAGIVRSLNPSINLDRNVGKSFPDLGLSPEQTAIGHVAAARKLMGRGLHEFALINLDALPASVKSSPGVAFLTARAAYGAKQYKKAREILARQFGTLLENPPQDAPRDFVEMAYPRVYFEETTRHATHHALDPNLIWAVIRQESRYDETAVSPAGALGLMQVTPGAVGIGSRDRKMTPSAMAGLLDPQRNLALGIGILSRNLASFKGGLVPAVASYNADIRKVRQWVSRNGKLKQDEFIESIPFLETRTYVKKVLAGYRAYGLVHGKKSLAGFW